LQEFFAIGELFEQENHLFQQKWLFFAIF
jgi:hypothetical protein